MSLLFARRAAANIDSLIPPRADGRGRPASESDALRHSAVWAALRLRADLISTLPVDVFRRVDGVQVAAPGSRLLSQPAAGMDIGEWVYSSQMDLDRYGNCFGEIVERDALGLPVQVELWPASEVRVSMSGLRLAGYRYGHRDYRPDQVWHERQYTVPGLRVGLSPLAYAAWSVGGYLSAQSFALDWFTEGAHPSGTLRNTEQSVMDPKVMAAAKARFKAAVANRDLFVTGKDWEFSPAAQDANGAAFLEQMRYGAADVCRFFGVPADAIDAGTSSSAVTYANITQFQLRLLVNNLGPAIIRRERALSAALPSPRYVKFNTDALLRLDPAARIASLAQQIDSRTLTPDEARELDNRRPLTPEQVGQFDALFNRGPSAPVKEVPK